MSNELNQTIANQESGKETQNLIIKLWELIRNTSEKIISYQETIIDLEQKNMYLDMQKSEESKKNHDLIHQVDNLNRELEHLNGNKSYYDDIVNSLESELESSSVYKFELDNLRNRYDLMELKLESIQKTADLVPVLKNEIEEKNHFLNDSTMQIAELKSTIKKLNTDLFNFIEIKKDLAAKNISLYERSNEIIKLKDKISFYDSRNFQIKNIENESETLKKHIVVLNNQMEEKQSFFESEKFELFNKISDYQDIVKKLRIELGSYETQSNTLQENIKSQHQIIYELTTDKNYLSNEIERLRNIIIENESSILQKSEENGGLENQLLILQNLLMDKDSEIESNKNNLKDLLSEIHESLDRNETFSNMIEAFQSDINSLENKVEQLNTELNEKDGIIQDFKVTLEETNNTLELKIVENSNFKFEVERLTAKINEIQTEYSIFESQINFLENDISSRKYEIIRMAKEFEEDKEKSEKVFSIAEKSYKSEIEKLNLQISDLFSEKILLTQRLQKINSKVERDSKTISEKEERIQIIENEITELKNTIILYDSDFDEYAKKEDEYISKTEEFKKIIFNLNGQIINKDSLINELKNIESQVSELNLENQNLGIEINLLKEQIEILETEKVVNSEMNLKISELNDDIKIKDIDINNLREKIADIEKQLAIRNEQINILDKQINDFKSEKQKKDFDKKALSEKIDRYIVLIDEELNIKS
jgi:chromosome segregation ATPase